jgi:D-alanyl-D-alanine carboxypeptidase (penicillin-binding protein 5/6)
MVLTASARGTPVTFRGAPTAQLSAPGSASMVADLGGHRAAYAASASPAVQAEAARSWSVQVGAFPNDRLATHQVDLIADTFKSLFDDREGQVDHSGHQYRAVFSGFTADEARDACAQVAAKGQPCQAVATRG